MLLNLTGCGNSGTAENENTAVSESKTDTAASTTAETTTAELTESVTTTTTAAETSKLTTTTGTTIVSTYDPATATEATTTTTTTTTAPPEEPSEMTPAEIIEKKKADGEFKEYESLYEMPEFKTDVPEEMSPDLYMYAEEKELTGHAVGYSNSRFGLGVTLYNGPSAAFSKASPYPVPYGHAVDVYARFQVSGDRLPREHGFVYDWLYCCYNGVWGWCESFELADSPIELPNVTMPDK